MIFYTYVFMKKGIIIEIKNKQKVVLADNGRFYVSTLKKGETVGSRVGLGITYTHLAAISAGAAFCITAFFAGMFAMKALNSSVPDTLVHIRAVSSSGQDTAVMEIVANSDGTVLSAAPVDEAAEVIMAGEDFTGISLEDAATLYLALSAGCGYVNVADGGFIAVGSYNYSQRSADGMQTRIMGTVNRYAVQHNLKLSSLRVKHKLPPGVNVSDCTDSYIVPVYIAALIQQHAEDSLEPLPEMIDHLKKMPNHKIMGIIRSAHIKYAQMFDSEKKSYLIKKKDDLTLLHQAAIDNCKQNPPGQHEVWNKTADSSSFGWSFETDIPLYLLSATSD